VPNSEKDAQDFTPVMNVAVDVATHGTEALYAGALEVSARR
jgi:hypothetical protein